MIYSFVNIKIEKLLSGPEGSRTPVQKPIRCSSTIIVSYLTFPYAYGN